MDWSVAWGDESNEADVTQYVTVTPTSNGSTVATVTCKQPFTGNIIVTVTTRENGYQASCVVTYVGMPTDIVLDTNIGQENGDYVVGIGVASTFNVSLTNPFGEAGAGYDYLSCEVYATANLILCSM